MRKDLFFCFTPLQVLIAKSIILSDDYEGGRPECYVFALSDSKRYQHYYELIAPHCAKAEFVTSLPPFPFYLTWLKQRFFRSDYRNIYIASIDSVYVQFVLSWAGFEEVRTFDDGTANILASSKYYCDDLSISFKLKSLIWNLFGNRYSKEIIIKESSVHYTLYPGFQNLIENLKQVSLNISDVDSGCENKKDRIIVFVGTVLKDVIKNADQQKSLIDGIRKYCLANLTNDAVYLPHPRDEFNYFPELPKRESTLIAEEVIFELINEYEEIELVGFGSSTQFNLMAQPSVKNVVLDSHLLHPRMRQLIQMLAGSGAEYLMLD